MGQRAFMSGRAPAAYNLVARATELTRNNGKRTALTKLPINQMMKNNYNINTQWHSLIDNWFVPWSGLNNLKCHMLQGPASCKFYRCFGISSFGFGRTKPGVSLLERWCGRGLDGIRPAFMLYTLRNRRPLINAINTLNLTILLYPEITTMFNYRKEYEFSFILISMVKINCIWAWPKETKS